MEKEKFVLSKNTFSETMKWLEQELCKAKISQKEILTAQLLLEETFLRLSEGAGHPEDFSVTVALRRRFLWIVPMPVSR